MSNPGSNYLSLGNIPLPPLFITLAAVYAVCLGVWVVHLRRNAIKVRGLLGVCCVL